MQNQKVFLSGHPSHQPGKRNLEVNFHSDDS